MTSRAPAPRRAAAATLGRFARDRRGGVMVEFAMWLPVLAGVLMVVADLSLMLAGNASMQNAARETARAVARGLIPVEEAEAHLRANLVLGDPAAYAVVVVPGAEVSVDVTVPGAALGVFGLFDILSAGNFTARAVMRRETE